MANHENAGFGSLLRAHRVEAGLSQERLAERAGLSVRGISDLERGERRSPRLETVRMLADALNLSQDDRVLLFRAAQRTTNGEPPHDAFASPESRRWTLPLPLTPIIGREREITRILELLEADEHRLLTLVGTGGVGKTRLAIEVAANAEAAYRDGVCFVALAAVGDPNLVMSAIIDALGIRDAGGGSHQAALERFLHGKQLMLVLDNFEHVLGAATGVSDLLAGCPGLTVLATSRVPLRLRGERQVPVMPLRLPDAKGSGSVAHVAETEAVRLFVARGQDARPDFALDDSNVAAVVDICCRLDGLPLALELAAVRVKVLSPQALAKRLERRLPLLIGGAQDQPARHQALRSTIAWSYDLLSSDEQALFRRLAIFAGGWSLEAAEAVVPAESAQPLFEGIASLVDKSLVHVGPGLGEEPRYQMLETVREYALEQLEESGEAGRFGRRHADYFLSLAEAGEMDPSDARYGGWLAQMETEQPNLRAALTWLRDRTLTHDGLRMSTALGQFWGWRTAHDEGRTWIETFLAQADSASSSARVRVAALQWLGRTAGYEGDLVTAEARLGESLSLAREVGDTHGIATTLGFIGTGLLHRGDVAESIPLLAEALALAREQGDRQYTAHLLAYLAYAIGHQGDLARAEELAAESVELTRSYDASRGFEAIIARMFQGWLAMMGGDAELGEERFAASLAMSRARGVKATQSSALAGLGEASFSRGRIDEAAARFTEGLRMGWEGKVQLGMAWNLQGVVRVAITRDERALAARLAGALEAFANEVRALPGGIVRIYEADVAHLRDVMGESSFAAELEQGRALDPAAIVAAALELNGEAPVSPGGLAGDA